MNDKELIYVRLEYEEALNGKRNILILERSLLRILQIINNYRTTRLNELKVKSIIYNKIKALKQDIAREKRILPKIKIPILKKDEEPEEEIKVKKRKEKYSNDVELQLKEIQEKLESMQR